MLLAMHKMWKDCVMRNVKRDALDAGIRKWPHITVRSIAKEIGVAHTAVLYHFKSLDRFKNAIATYAVDTHNTAVVLQLITSDHPIAKTLTDRDRAVYLKSIGG
jgi:AcrR family transcriptional regulator